jgi:hypothetical protein
MKLPLTANEMAEVHDAAGRLVADFYSSAFTPDEDQANAEHYAAMMNRLMPVNNEDDGA